MQREIKFRAWSGALRKMITKFDNSVEPGFAIYQEDDSNIKSIQPIFCGGYLKNGDWDQPILMQYTGLKDRRGKEIYEGDILKGFYYGEESGLDEVIFENGKFVLKATPEDLIAFTYALSEHQCEVVGNIYQHLDLLSNPAQ